MSKVVEVKNAAENMQKICQDIMNEEDPKRFAEHFQRLNRQYLNMKSNL